MNFIYMYNMSMTNKIRYDVNTVNQLSLLSHSDDLLLLLLHRAQVHIRGYGSTLIKAIIQGSLCEILEYHILFISKRANLFADIKLSNIVEVFITQSK